MSRDIKEERKRRRRRLKIMRILLVVLILAVVVISAFFIHEFRLVLQYNESVAAESGSPPETESETQTEEEAGTAAGMPSEAAAASSLTTAASSDAAGKTSSETAETPSETAAAPSETAAASSEIAKTETVETLIIDPTIETTSGLYPDIPQVSGARVWVGDSRTEGIRLYVGGDPAADYFIAKVGEGYSWFTAEATPQLESMLASGNIGAVLIDLGVNDCAASVDYPDQFRAYDYAARINELIARYPDVLFVFYSVGPCSGDYARLNGEISRFNDVMKSECRAWYVDTARFLETEGFNSFEGLHYDQDTCTRIYNFVIDNI